ncbi:hypothetical protein KKB55_08310, partial [Myxococcota bacterium]|nr:hypothetical protein [Myxococcota bacterium]MBU1897748.1 hypothetical protein [Myxococcota bacterium]
MPRLTPSLLLCLFAVAALPDQSWGGASRLVLAAALPFLYGQHLARSPWSWAWLALAGVALLRAPDAEGARLALSLISLAGAWAWGVHHRDVALDARGLALAGALAALPGLWMRGGLFYNPTFLAGFLALTLTLTLARLPHLSAAPRPRLRQTRAWVALSLLLQLAALVKADSLAAYGALAVAG